MSGDIHEFGEFRFVVSAREQWRAGRRVELPRRTFECLEHLITHRDRAVGRDELVAAIFGRTNVSDAQLGQIVLRARRAVDDDGNAQRVIRTIPGYGYRWVAEVRVRAGDANANEHAASAFGVPLSERTAADSPNTSTATPPTKSARRRNTRRLWAVAAISATALLAIALMTLRRGDVPVPPPTAMNALPSDSIVVLPIEVDGLREDAWVRLGAMDLVADRLREAGMTVPPSESVLSMMLARNDSSAQNDAQRLR
jgi:DNA-binding winged helix-turn-helix (wHTH) protein